MAQPFPHPKTGVFQFRRRVPTDLRSSLGLEYKRSLKTRDPAEAKRRHAAVWIESQTLFDRARSHLAGTSLISAIEVRQLAEAWFSREQERLEHSRAFSEMLAESQLVILENSEGYEEIQTYVTLREWADEERGDSWMGIVRPIAQQAMRDANYPMPREAAPEYALLIEAFGAHVEKLSSWALQRQKGNWVAVSHPGLGEQTYVARSSQLKARQKKERTLARLFEAYADAKLQTDGDNRATRGTINEYRAIVRAFTELHGDLEVALIDRELVYHHRAQLARLPVSGEGIRGLRAPERIAHAELHQLERLSAATIRNRLRALSAVLSHGQLLGWLSENPVIASGVSKAAAKAATQESRAGRRRLEYTVDELATIFQSPAFQDIKWAPPRARFGRAWYWMPILWYYTGARREEIAQLGVVDVQQNAGGLWYLSILSTEGSDEGRTVKTSGSRRIVPLHSDVIARGFVEYVQSLPREGKLFPHLRADSSGYFGTNFGKRWAVYLRETVRLNSSVSPVHGFRHTFKTLCREAGIPEDVHDAITGHQGNNVARDYGSMPLARMKIEIERFPTIPKASELG